MPSEAVTSQPFAAVVGVRPNGMKALTMSAPDFYQNELNKLRSGERVTVILTTERPKRSVAQNSFWWKYMTIIGDETGHSPEEIHEWAKGKFLTKEVVTVYGQPVRMKGSTTTLSKSGFSDLIRNVEEATGILAPTLDSDDDSDAKAVVLNAVNQPK